MLAPPARAQRTLRLSASTFCANFLTAASSPPSGSGMSCARAARLHACAGARRRASRGRCGLGPSRAPRLQALHEPPVRGLEVLERVEHDVVFISREASERKLARRGATWGCILAHLTCAPRVAHASCQTAPTS